jgi:hypothetical protein
MSLLRSLASDCPHWLVKATWVLFSTAGVHQILLVVVFWSSGLFVPDDLNFVYIMRHGGVMVVTLVEGLLINRVPVRLQHALVTEILGIMYLLWSVFHSFVLYENPDAEEFDGGVYEILLWRENPGQAVFMSLGILLLVIPLATLALWGASLPKRLYKTESGIVATADLA